MTRKPGNNVPVRLGIGLYLWAAVAIPSNPALAGGPEYSHLSDFSRCVATSTPADLKISSCMAALKSDMTQRNQLGHLFLSLGVGYIEKQDWAHAIPALNTAVEYDPDEAKAYNNRGFAFSGLGDTERALQDLNKAISLDSGISATYINRGRVYSHLKQFNNALQDFDKAIQLQPGNAAAFYFRSGVYDRMGEFGKELADLDRIIAIHPEAAEFWNSRCFARAKLGTDLTLALADCSKSLELRPNDSNTLDSRGLVEFRMGSYAAAISDSDAALAGNEKLASSLYIRGLARRKSGDTAGGDADIAAARAIDPKIAETYAGYGVTP